jgi:hypothetical protein
MQAEKQIANEPSATRQELQFVLGAGLIAFLLFAYYFYTWHNFKWGQVGLFTTVSILGALLFLERDRRIFDAALFAFAVSFKFFPLIFVAPFIIRRDFRFLFYVAIACGLFLIVIPCLFLGIGGTGLAAIMLGRMLMAFQSSLTALSFPADSACVPRKHHITARA